ncbi:MAG: ORF6N domain-containing protein [Elusimicrobia bacterium]|nr:ORF6N domain-containing protein [Elusimicrobiota bacterium]
MRDLIPIETIEQRIYLLRGQKVMLSMDLARLYGVETRVLNQAVKRNAKRFPGDFMFMLTPREAGLLVSQNVIPHRKHLGGHLPYAFTEHGAVMLASVLNSPIAVEASIQVVRAFVRLRRMVSASRTLARRLDGLEREVKSHGTHIQSIFSLIGRLMDSPAKPRRQIGFTPPEKPG